MISLKNAIFYFLLYRCCVIVYPDDDVPIPFFAIDLDTLLACSLPSQRSGLQVLGTRHGHIPQGPPTLSGMPGRSTAMITDEKENRLGDRVEP